MSVESRIHSFIESTLPRRSSVVLYPSRLLLPIVDFYLFNSGPDAITIPSHLHEKPHANMNESRESLSASGLLTPCALGATCVVRGEGTGRDIQEIKDEQRLNNSALVGCSRAGEDSGRVHEDSCNL